jgi:hypothetical protein
MGIHLKFCGVILKRIMERRFAATPFVLVSSKGSARGELRKRGIKIKLQDQPSESWLYS